MGKLAFGAMAVGLVTTGVLWAKKKSWILVGHVKNLYIFPLKSGGVIESQNLEFKSMGPQLGVMIDRGFAVAREGTYTVKDTHDYTRRLYKGTPTKIAGSEGFEKIE